MASVECDLINARDGYKLVMVRLSQVPRVGDEIDVDLGPRHQSVYRVVRVRFHIRRRKMSRRDAIIGVSIFILPAA